MYRLLGFATQNTMKTLYVLEELGVDYEFQFVDLMKGENKKEAFLKLNPVGKTPVLQHNDDSLFESGAICRYLANVEESPLYPTNKLQRGKVDQWMDFFSCHLGRWLSALYFEKIIKGKVAMGSPSAEKCAEAESFIQQQLTIVNNWLKGRKYFTGDQLTIADLFAFAYVEQKEAVGLSLKECPQVQAWFNSVEKRESIQRARKRIAQ